MCDMASKRIVGSPRGVFVETPGKMWAAILGVVLGVVWFVLCLPAFTGEALALLWALLVTSIVGVPALALLVIGSRRRRRVNAVLNLREVPGGVFVEVIDAQQRRHELVVSPDVAAGMVNVLSARTLRS